MRWTVIALLAGGLTWSCLDDALDPRPPAPDPQADGGTFDPDLIGSTSGGSGYGSGGAAGGGGQRPPPMPDLGLDGSLDDEVDGQIDAALDAALDAADAADPEVPE